MEVQLHKTMLKIRHSVEKFSYRFTLLYTHRLRLLQIGLAQCRLIDLIEGVIKLKAAPFFDYWSFQVSYCKQFIHQSVLSCLSEDVCTTGACVFVCRLKLEATSTDKFIYVCIRNTLGLLRSTEHSDGTKLSNDHDKNTSTAKIHNRKFAQQSLSSQCIVTSYPSLHHISFKARIRTLNSV